MSIKEVQHFLASIYTNSKIRDSFFDNPKRLKTDFNLTDAEIKNLSKLDKEKICFFSDSLKYKRKNEVSKIITNTYNILGKEAFKELFFSFSESYNPKGEKKHLFDALYFLKFLKKKSEIISKKEKFKVINFDYSNIMFYTSKYYFNILIKKTTFYIWIKTPYFQINQSINLPIFGANNNE